MAPCGACATWWARRGASSVTAITLAKSTGPAKRWLFCRDHAPDPQALDFCFRWQEFGRALQQRAGDSYFDADGAIAVGPVVTPRLTPVASRGEAAVATLDVGRRQGFAPAEVAKLDDQLRRSFALLVRQQFRPGPRHLFREPAHVYGGMPGSEVDWELRIDFAQHAGSAMVRWLETADGGSRAAR